jgi:hypothetical protein
MKFKIIGATKVTNSINFFKKRENWQDIFTTALSNVANAIRDDAEKKVYQRWKRRTGRLGKSIEPLIGNKGNKVFFGLQSDHPAAKIIEYGGYSPMPSSKSKSIVEYGYIYEGGDSSDPFFELARGIWQNQPFAQGTFACRNALLEGMDDINSEIMRTAHRMKPK